MAKIIGMFARKDPSEADIAEFRAVLRMTGTRNLLIMAEQREKYKPWELEQIGLELDERTLFPDVIRPEGLK